MQNYILDKSLPSYFIIGYELDGIYTKIYESHRKLHSKKQ